MPCFQVQVLTDTQSLPPARPPSSSPRRVFRNPKCIFTEQGIRRMILELTGCRARATEIVTSAVGKMLVLFEFKPRDDAPPRHTHDHRYLIRNESGITRCMKSTHTPEATTGKQEETFTRRRPRRNCGVDLPGTDLVFPILTPP